MSNLSVAAPARGDSSSSSKAAGLKPLTLASGPRPLQLQASALPSPSSASSSRFPPPASPSSRGLSRSNSTNSTPTGHSKRPVPKRLSSISYNTVSSDTFGASSSSSYASPLRSAPLLEEPRRARPSSFHAGSTGLSLGQSTTTAPTTSNSSDGPGPSGLIAEQPKQPAVQTLTEKHADLLRFIATKESKCLELRTQLEQHEAELAVLKKKWERIVSKAKAKELAATSSSASGGSASAAAALQGTHPGTSGGDVVVEALMGVGRYLGGSLGLADDGSSTLAAPKPSRRQRSTSSESSVSTSPPISALSLEESSIPPAEVLAGVKPMVGRAGGFSSSRGHKRHIYSKGSNGSITSSPSSSTVPSARASLSSVSTSMSSLEVTMTPGRNESSHVDRFDAAGQLESLGMSPDQDKTGAAVPWIPIPGLNKKWEQIQKGSGLEKQAKRASLLLSDVTDMSSSILGSLSSVLLSPTPSGNGPSPRPEVTNPVNSSRSSKPRPISIYSPHIPAPTFNAVKTSPSSSTTRSLLDEDDDDAANFGSLSKPILPSGGPATATTPSTAQQAKKAMEPADADDDWNW